MSSEDEEVLLRVDEKKPSLDTLNTYLAARDISPVRSQLQTPWEKALAGTKRYYTRKAGQATVAILNDISPQDSQSLFSEVASSGVFLQQFISSEEVSPESNVDETLMAALSECYGAANNWATRRQILSIMADKVLYKTLLKYVPDLTKYRYTEAKRHCLTHGRGMQVLHERAPRWDVSPSQIEHFIMFITSPHIMQDLPFGQRSIVLSDKTTIKVPNVIRTLIPERVLQQYTAYCDECNFTALSRSKLLRVLSVCSACSRKSLQGLDYISSSGAPAFDNLAEVAEKLGGAGKGMHWVKDVQNGLRAAKRYLKSRVSFLIDHLDRTKGKPL